MRHLSHRGRSSSILHWKKKIFVLCHTAITSHLPSYRDHL